MFHCMHQALNHGKSGWLESVFDDAFLQSVVRQCEVTWRERILNPMFTLRLFLLQILEGNIGCQALSQLSGRKFSGNAYCQARQRLPLRLFTTLLKTVTASIQQRCELSGADRWRGHRVLLIDGTGFSMPDTPALQSHFGRKRSQKKGCGFPVAYSLMLMHHGSGLIEQLLVGTLKTGEAKLLTQLLDQLQPGDVVVADSAYGSYGQIALLAERGVHVVFRVSKKRIVDFTPGRPHVIPESRNRQLNPGLPRSRWLWQWDAQDQIVQWLKPWKCPNWLKEKAWKSLPAERMLREVRYDVSQKGFRTRSVTLVTTLLDAQNYPVDALADLYRRRWEIETNFRHLKMTLKMDVLKCQTVAGVLKEMTMFCIVYNLVRLAMGIVARKQNKPLQHISFQHTLHWMLAGASGDTIELIHTRPLRPDRIEPRVRKRRAKNYNAMTTHRAKLRQMLINKQPTA